MGFKKETVVGSINGSIRKLKPLDWEPQIVVPSKGKPSLVATINGNAEVFPISVALAEVLIASGMSYGN